MLKYILIALLFLCSCSRNKNTPGIDPRIIYEMAHDDRTTPSRFDFDFFVRCKNGKVAMINEPALWEIHRENPKRLSYIKFLDLALNQEIEVDNTRILSVADCFLLDSKIAHYYKSHSLEDFLLAYFLKENSGWRLKDGYAKSQLMSISYYCFINNKFLLYDDYIGIYTLVEANELFKRK
ncbi:MAG: hypothetical protein LBJ04_04855 [Sphingobacterium sp.]|jgi:hypothetical protein|nr:hypothetical protein [Sphingobacterium sp.]